MQSKRTRNEFMHKIFKQQKSLYYMRIVICPSLSTLWHTHTHHTPFSALVNLNKFDTTYKKKFPPPHVIDSSSDVFYPYGKKKKALINSDNIATEALLFVISLVFPACASNLNLLQYKTREEKKQNVFIKPKKYSHNLKLPQPSLWNKNIFPKTIQSFTLPIPHSPQMILGQLGLHAIHSRQEMWAL